jgi:hypothetical protein
MPGTFIPRNRICPSKGTTSFRSALSESAAVALANKRAQDATIARAPRIVLDMITAAPPFSDWPVDILV